MLKKISILYASQLYRAAFPLMLVPLIIGLLGTERYGIVSFFTMLITLMGLLDAGISGTFVKLIATNKYQLASYTKVVKLFLKVFLGFVFIACTVAFIFNYSSIYIVNDWLKTSLSNDETVFCIKIIGIILALLYLRSYLQSFINGMERQDLIAIWGMVYTTCFYGGGYVVLAFYSNSLSAFFKVLLTLSIIDVIVTAYCVYYVIHKHSKQLGEGCSGNNSAESEDIAFSKVIKFSLQLSGLSMIWVVASQVDKIALSTYTTLTNYTQYQIGSQLSAVVLTLVIPLSQILLPRLSALIKEKKESQFVAIFTYSSIAYVVILGPLVPYMFIFGSDLIALWLKNDVLGNTVNQYAKWLVSATFFAGIMNFVFILLYSTGKLKYHFYAYAGYSALTIPLTILIAKYLGPQWSSVFYFTHTVLFLIIWGFYCLTKEMVSYLKIIAPVTLIIISFSTIIFETIEHFSMFGNYKYLYIFGAPIVNLVIISMLMLSTRFFILPAIKKISLRNWQF
ncbi:MULTISPECIES: lipopolysaccharide biosynthesis protein [Citrobacter]|uniref:lipopolysaccharide biosynthesis protein n=1 Tax=Citrobacter TaxID=544 RepID=UPI00190024E5|nr:MULTISPECIES: oligosaccharide flippase family protein [Citrobacter]EKW1726629.1 hypothetical protein [Citrobacter freundii]ELS0843821.1 hypothetical protein [Citrobacter freundii]MBJ8800883.1 hypothetical protein [Citrobacter freundii]MDM3121702.1 oligosaccharide flippase family protein [Citrobacter sp. Cf125]HBV0977306.1 hypothetical protein [Citrobacter freundii]